MPTGSLGGFSLPIPELLPRNGCRGLPLLPGPKEGVNAVSWVPELCAIEAVLAQDVWVGFAP